LSTPCGASEIIFKPAEYMSARKFVEELWHVTMFTIRSEKPIYHEYVTSEKKAIKSIAILIRVSIIFERTKKTGKEIARDTNAPLDCVWTRKYPNIQLPIKESQKAQVFLVAHRIHIAITEQAINDPVKFMLATFKSNQSKRLNPICANTDMYYSIIGPQASAMGLVGNAIIWSFSMYFSAFSKGYTT